MVAFIGVIGYGLSVVIGFLWPSEMFFSVSGGFHSSAKDQGAQLSSVSAPSTALTSSIAPALVLSLADCQMLPLLTLFLQSHHVRSTISQCYWQSPALRKHIEVVKENVLYSRNSTEIWKDPLQNWTKKGPVSRNFVSWTWEIKKF